jgi:endonuclease-3 related protein
LANLRAAQALSLEGIRKLTLAKLERLIRPSGYFRQKAKRLKTFVAFLDTQYGGSLDKLFAQPTDKLREQLLGYCKKSAAACDACPLQPFLPVPSPRTPHSSK